ncbi:hypothetical protein [Acidianus sp. HS-5]|uniref:hypothetical protein n=1 Tax=Acidianus sp. HS-5 TaxID=2886040 RepID=UPI001F38A638|nr:hypothetical protein [Acidianus sp. HS-5]
MEYIRIEGIIGLVIVVGILLAIVLIGPGLTQSLHVGPSNFNVISAKLLKASCGYVINATIEASGIPGKCHDNLYAVTLNGTTYYAFYEPENGKTVVWYYNGTSSYPIYLSTSNTTYSPPSNLPNTIYNATFVSQQGKYSIMIGVSVAPKPTLKIIQAQILNVSGLCVLKTEVNANIPAGYIYFYEAVLNGSTYYIFYHPKGDTLCPVYYIDKSGVYNVSLYIYPENFTKATNVTPNSFEIKPGIYKVVYVTSVGNYTIMAETVTSITAPQFSVENTATESTVNGLTLLNFTITATTPAGSHICVYEISINGHNYTVYYKPEVSSSAIGVYVYQGTKTYPFYINGTVSAGTYTIIFYYCYEGVHYIYTGKITIS